MKRRANAAIAALKAADENGNWTTFAIAADEAIGIGSAGLRHAWGMLSRIEQMAREAMPANV